MQYKDAIELLDTIEEAIEYLKINDENELFSKHMYLVNDLIEGVRSVNLMLFKSKEVTVLDTCALWEERDELLRENLFFSKLEEWRDFSRNIIDNRKKQANDIDETFVWLMDYVQYVGYDTIFENVKANLIGMDRTQMEKVCRYYQNYSYLWGSLDVSNSVFDVIENRLDKLINHRTDFLWLYSQLGDYRSKLVLVNTLLNWITFDPLYIVSMKETNFRDYYDLDLLQCDENEVLVDVGAYIGDSVLDYIRTYRKYKKIYCYEITKNAIEEMQNNLEPYDNIEIINKGVGSMTRKMFIKKEIGGDSCNSLSDKESEIEVEVVTIDDDIEEKITLIKMDIEGGEKEALLGCRNHIQKEHPKLLICVYHNNEDIYELPKLIRSMNSQYKLFLRSNGNQWGPAELVLFAL